VAAARKASQYFRSVICLRSTRLRSQIATICTMQSRFTPPRSVTSLARAVSRRSPQRPYPRVYVYSVRRRLSAPAHGTQEARLLWGVLPAIITFQRHSTQHPSIVDCRSLSGPIFLLQEVPFSCVQRTGCSACGLGYPHQVWWAPLMYIARAWSR
jgi:hypothetical protein